MNNRSGIGIDLYELRGAGPIVRGGKRVDIVPHYFSPKGRANPKADHRMIVVNLGRAGEGDILDHQAHAGWDRIELCGRGHAALWERHNSAHLNRTGGGGLDLLAQFDVAAPFKFCSVQLPADVLQQRECEVLRRYHAMREIAVDVRFHQQVPERL